MTGYLKVAPADRADRELRFYRDLAAYVPVRTPALLDVTASGSEVSLLLEDAGVTRPPDAWSDEDSRRLGRALADLHAMALPAGDWSRDDPLLRALDEPDLERVSAFWAGLPSVLALVGSRVALAERLRAEPAVFVHGDCHTDNLLHGPAGLTFCDWEAAGLGRAASDVAFFNVRAAPFGTCVPGLVLDEHQRRSTELGVATDPVEFEHVVALEELAVLVFQWPEYAGFNTPAGIERVRGRVARLVDLVTP